LVTSAKSLDSVPSMAARTVMCVQLEGQHSEDESQKQQP
jgi:hypothetical protein